MRINHTAPYNSSRFSQPLALLLVGLFLLLSPCVWGEKTWGGKTEAFSQGSGTQKAPYIIDTPEKLAYLANWINSSGNGGYASKYYLQTEDFDMANIEFYPIGDGNKDARQTTIYHYFKGHYDGGNHIIKNLKLSGARTLKTGGKETTETTSNIALFGVVQGGTSSEAPAEIKNLVLENVTSTSSNPANFAGFIAKCASGYLKIENCCVQGKNSNIGPAAYAAGIIAQNAGICTITKCSNKCSITANSSSSSFAGGIVGYNSGTLTISISSNTGNITSAALETDKTNLIAYAGGIVGQNGGTCTVSYCYNTGSLSATADHTDWIYVGNEISYASGIGYGCTVDHSYNAGTISTADYKYGITNGTHSDSYSNGNCGKDDTQYGIKKSETELKATEMPGLLNANPTQDALNNHNGGVVFVLDRAPEINQGYPIFYYLGKFIVNATCDPSDVGTVSGVETYYDYNSTATITATKNDDKPCYSFTGWKENNTIIKDASGNIIGTTYTFTITNDRTLTATFTSAGPFEVKVTANDPKAGKVCITEQ